MAVMQLFIFLGVLMVWETVAAVVGAGILGARASSKASDVAKEGAERSARQIQEGMDLARRDVQQIFPEAQKDLLTGAAAAADIFGQGITEQQRLLSAGNLAAQQTVGQGFGQVQNALLGLPVDQSSFAPQTIAPSQLPVNPITGQAISPLGQPSVAPVDGGVFSQLQTPAQVSSTNLAGIQSNRDLISKIDTGEIEIPGVDTAWFKKLLRENDKKSGGGLGSSLSFLQGADTEEQIQERLARSGLNNENKLKLATLLRGVNSLRQGAANV